MSQPLICHFLIGIPASGKSTLAHKLQAMIPNSAIISTDTARKKLFGDESIQGEWTSEIEPEILEQVKDAISSNKPVIYDATNVKRDWRMGMIMKIEHKLQEINAPQVYWVAWHLQTPIDVCKEWNQNRERKVPEEIIEQYAALLNQFSPHQAEGFIQILNVFSKQELTYEIKLEKKILHIKQAVAIKHDFSKKQNRKKRYIWHQYSRLLDFERLMHLISTIIRYPGIGNLSQTAPETLKKALHVKDLASFSDSIEEIAAVIKKEYAPLYANIEAIQRDLAWLEKNGLIGNIDITAEIDINLLEDSEVNLEHELFSHRYSDLESFSRLIKIIRFITYNPFLLINGKTAIKKTISGNQFDTVRCTAIVEGLITSEVLLIDMKNIYERKKIENLVREDIRQLSPYRIIHDPFKTKPYTNNFSKIFAMKKGYFIGTGIFSKDDLNEIYNLLRSQAKEEYFNDPLAQKLYQNFEERMQNSKLWQDAPPYPVKVIGSKSVVDFNQGVNQSRFEAFDNAIRNSKLIKLEILRQPWESQKKVKYINVHPLQIVFHLFAWYLGYEVVEEGEEKGLFYFERIDRLRVEAIFGSRSQQDQLQSLKKLNKLYQASAGIYLGKSVSEQKNYLNPKTRKSFEETIKIYATKKSFKFLSETSHRFSEYQMKMSKPEWLEDKLCNEKIYSLKIQENKYPHVYRINITVPKWSIEDIYLIQWLVPWGKEVKVTHPEALIKKIQQRGKEIMELYDNQ